MQTLWSYFINDLLEKNNEVSFFSRLAIVKFEILAKTYTWRSEK